MSMKKAIVTGVIAGVVGLACTTASWARDVLRVGTEPTFAPFEYLDTKTKEFAGFDIDLIRAIGEKAGYDVEIVNMGFDALIPALTTGNIDVIASGLSITPERAERVNFMTPNYQTGLSILVKKTDADTLKTTKDLEGKVIAVQIGNTGADKAKSIPNAKVKTFNTTSDAFMELMQGGADAVILDRPVIAYFLKTRPKAAKNLVLQPSMDDVADFGFAVSKDNPELLAKLNKAYEEVKASGQEKRIFSKYFAE